MLNLVQTDNVSGNKISDLGRKDIPSVGRIVKAAICKELKGVNCRELEYYQEDSRICDQFLKIDEGRQYSLQIYPKHISKVKSESLDKLLVALHKITIGEGLGDTKRTRTDSTVVQTNIHYSTNNTLGKDLSALKLRYCVAR